MTHGFNSKSFTLRAGIFWRNFCNENTKEEHLDAGLIFGLVMWL